MGRDRWLSNPLHEAGPIRTGYRVPCAVKVLVFPGLEILQCLQACLPVNDHPRGEKPFLVSKPKLTFLQTMSSCLLCTM